MPHDGCAEGLEPAERVVEALPDEPLQTLVAAGTFATELLPAPCAAR